MKYIMQLNNWIELKELDERQEHANRILSITKQDDNIIISEECDNWFTVEYTKQEAIEMLQEIIKWINETDKS